MTAVGPDPGDFTLVPPPDLLGTRPPTVRRAAAVAGVLWWGAGLLGVVAALVVVAAPVGGRPLASALAFVGVGVFAAAVVASGLAALLTARWEVDGGLDEAVVPTAGWPELPAAALAELEADDGLPATVLPAPRAAGAEGTGQRTPRQRAGR